MTNNPCKEERIWTTKIESVNKAFQLQYTRTEPRVGRNFIICIYWFLNKLCYRYCTVCHFKTSGTFWVKRPTLSLFFLIVFTIEHCKTFQFMPGHLQEGARDDEQAAQSTPVCNWSWSIMGLTKQDSSCALGPNFYFFLSRGDDYIYKIQVQSI